MRFSERIKRTHSERHGPTYLLNTKLPIKRNDFSHISYATIYTIYGNLVNGRDTVADPYWYTAVAVVSVYTQLDSQT